MQIALLENAAVNVANRDATVANARSRQILATASWYSLFWLVVANAVGVLLATLLLFPRLNAILGEWTYGRWMPVHINLQLYGWCSLPLVAFLFRAFNADTGPAARWCRPVLWVWSVSLAVGALSWLNGSSSGKLFLDWTGYARVLFPLALTSLWVLLAWSFRSSWRSHEDHRLGATSVKIISLILLLCIPPLLFVAANPALYPPINPDTGGPTGASQLESVLVIVAILLLFPHVLAARSSRRIRFLVTAWIAFAVEALLCLALGRADVSHHRPTQYISLASLLIWIPLIPIYYRQFAWHPNSKRWRIATLIWWSILVPTGWGLFLPGVLDRFKFTDGLVAHSLLAMAGFASSLLILALVQLLGDDNWILNGTRSFYIWQFSVAAYVLIMFVAGWLEGFNPAFAIIPGRLRDSIYALRLLLGVLMFLASAYWLLDASTLLRKYSASISPERA